MPPNKDPQSEIFIPPDNDLQSETFIPPDNDPQSETFTLPLTNLGTYRTDSIRRKLLTGMRDLRSGPHWKKILSVVVILLLLPVSFVILMEYAGSVVDRSEVEIISVHIIGSDEETLSLELDLNITNPSSITTTMEPSHLDLNYQGKKAASLSLPSMKLEPGNNSLTLRATLKEYGPGGMQQLADDLLSSVDVQVSVTGTVGIKGWIPLEFPLNKQITLDRFNGPEIDILEISIDESSAVETLTGMVHTEITNPSSIETTLDGLHFDILYDGSPLASITSQEYLRAGVNDLSMAFTVPNGAMDTARTLTSHLLNGSLIDLDIKGNGSSGTLLSRLTSGFSYTYTDNTSQLASFDDLEIDVRSISINETDTYGMRGYVTVGVTNPSVLTIPLDSLEFSIQYNDSLLAELTTTTTPTILKPGTNEILLSMFVPADAGDAYNILASEMLNGGNFSFTIVVVEQENNPLSYLASTFRYAYHMNISDGITTSVSSLRVSPGIFTTGIDITVVLDNPSPISINLENFELIAYYQGSYLSHINLHDPWIVPGSQTVDLDMSVSTISLQNLGLLVKLLTGSDIDLLIEAKHEFDPENIFRFFLTTTL